MLKKVGLPFLALAGLMMVVPAQKADAAVRFGVVVGGPVAYPAYPDPYACPPPYDNYNAYPPYVAPAPGYVYGYGAWRAPEWREHREHERYERHGWRERAEHEGRRGRR